MNVASANKRFYGLYSQFDPKLILLQIIAMQAVYYMGLGLLMTLFDFAFGLRPHLGQLFHHSCFNTDHGYGQIAILAHIFNIAVVIAGLSYVVEKGSKVLDFVATTYIIHGILAVFYNRSLAFETSWWFVNLSVCGTTVLLGEYILIKFEQQEIRLFENLLGIGTQFTAATKRDEEKKSAAADLENGPTTASSAVELSVLTSKEA
eukprot:TRINITY_DN15510_c0_g1_i1.p1 TRINITY_DN15510_c0_g1~~TRINITY_DN15510_c0_g1_i1.p1  ORF type:complete len:205 (-),score=25.99 TRINITY_DN15510_c0_g1_i1:102-716(-)